jgi:DNA-3-methyladenine glycosylase
LKRSASSSARDRGLVANLRPLHRSFYARPTLDVARDLLGTVLVRRVLAGRIVEVEAYIGEEDPACHASHGRTPRTEVLYGPPGYAYVYFTYGMHFLVNAVTERRDFPAAVLLRALEPLVGTGPMRRRRGGRRDRELTSGPARLTAALGIDLRHNRTDLTRPPLFIAEPPGPSPETISWSPRIGIRRGREKVWRCYLEGNPFVSRTRTPSQAPESSLPAPTRGRKPGGNG